MTFDLCYSLFHVPNCKSLRHQKKNQLSSYHRHIIISLLNIRGKLFIQLVSVDLIKHLSTCIYLTKIHGYNYMSN